MIFLLLAAVLWGVTNPLLKKFSAGMDKKGSSGVLEDLKFLLQRPKYLVTQGANLCGSVAFFYGLRDVHVSTGSIAANSLAFIITVAMSVWVLKEGTIRRKTYGGMLCVVVGTALCTLSR